MLFSFPTARCTAQHTADCIKIVLQTFPGLQRVVTDSAQYFITDRLWDELAQFHLQKSASSSYHPKGNSIVERRNKSLKDILKMLTPNHDYAHWATHLSKAVMLVNALPSIYGYSSFELLSGIKVSPTKLLEGSSLTPHDFTLLSQQVAGPLEGNFLRRDLTGLRLLQLTDISKKRENQRAKQVHKRELKQTIMNRLSNKAKFTVDEYVMRRNNAHKKGAPHSYGPFRIHKALDMDTYKLAQLNGKPISGTVNGKDLSRAYQYYGSPMVAISDALRSFGYNEAKFLRDALNKLEYLDTLRNNAEITN